MEDVSEWAIAEGVWMRHVHSEDKLEDDFRAWLTMLSELRESRGLAASGVQHSVHGLPTTPKRQELTRAVGFYCKKHSSGCPTHLTEPQSKSNPQRVSPQIKSRWHPQATLRPSISAKRLHITVGIQFTHRAQTPRYKGPAQLQALSRFPHAGVARFRQAVPGLSSKQPKGAPNRPSKYNKVEVPLWSGSPSRGSEGVVPKLGHSLPQPSALLRQRLPGAAILGSVPSPRTHQHSRRPAPGAPPAYPRPGIIILSRRPVHPKGCRAQKGKPPPARGRGSPKGYPTAWAPKPRGPRPDQPPTRPLRTLSLPAVHNCRERLQFFSSPRHKSAQGVEDSTRPAHAELDRGAELGRPAMLQLSPGLPGRHLQARPRRSRPQDKR
ncbi:hypothetical protein NDU88_001488 [Pleurodeles waltl]|uniref:Uncharacterized protein n=1 Tax=Pleurodeles waltl TaxID=8319 RepID=A0AAV7U759_PLEWA|nr:hypothetical protein NDU88_001488 [Pleurodeles waltl]